MLLYIHLNQLLVIVDLLANSRWIIPPIIVVPIFTEEEEVFFSKLQSALNLIPLQKPKTFIIFLY